jgi:hypothetical protein
LDAGKSDFSGSELRIVDLSGAKAAPVTVVTGIPAGGEKAIIVDKPAGTFSASVYVDHSNGIAYCTSSFGNPQEIRFFTIAELVQAYQSSTPLDWTADGTLIGGGVAGKTFAGELVVGGNGTVQLINPRLDNPALATVVDSFDPTGAGGFYTAFHNSVTNITTFYGENNVAYVFEGTLTTVPAVGALGVAMLCGGLILVARRRLSK